MSGGPALGEAPAGAGGEMLPPSLPLGEPAPAAPPPVAGPPPSLPGVVIVDNAVGRCAPLCVTTTATSLNADGSVITDFDLIEMDEGRWYPEMWRDAWK